MDEKVVSVILEIKLILREPEFLELDCIKFIIRMSEEIMSTDHYYKTRGAGRLRRESACPL